MRSTCRATRFGVWTCQDEVKCYSYQDLLCARARMEGGDVPKLLYTSHRATGAVLAALL